jgi:hypothetical protein
MSFEKAFGIEQVNASAKIVLAHNAFCHAVRLHDYASRPTGLYRALMGVPPSPRSMKTMEFRARGHQNL